MTKRITKPTNLKYHDIWEEDDVCYQTTYIDLSRNDFCCNEIYEVLLGEGDGNCELSFGYDPVLREYFIGVRPEYGGTCQLIKYCPWCGKKFPKELLNEFIEELKKELNIKDDDIGFAEIRERTDIPEEFKSDAWWKKRSFY
ncbi:DUF6980 family protein [endosymbiont GvMRE of Glomus versiforme]|uniref:DUF6980 family protein n=1 Tax=endosymbiont GvMRE of Glomus versiforme TaxID=2039283 RepID=UPI000ECB3E80|nr:hypothetical protein [endosymbiont GvMRE of Glomus versiforme]RHZ35208.1 hypothetical protein GvMRE_IIg201 [endosymbiont GvMRE of Glomus versiforme]